jgi:hypothetical protein
VVCCVVRGVRVGEPAAMEGFGKCGREAEH